MIAVVALLLSALLSIATCAAEEAKFVPLFDGKSLDGWEGAVEGYMVKDGMLVCREGAIGNLLTRQEFSDFDLSFEFLLALDANKTKKYGVLQDFQYHGSLYGVAPAVRGHQKPAGEWNKQEVHCVGRNISVTLNGTKILDVDLDKVAPNGETIDHKDHPGLSRKTGRVGFLSHGDKVSFRNIMIKDLSNSPAAKADK
jgi:hypothetical protein